METNSVFAFRNYKKYISVRLPTTGAERGIRARLAEKLKCQGAYISQVLNGTTQFSLEHAALIDQFLGHSHDESDFFMLLVHYGRAGSKALETIYLRQIEEQLKKRQNIARRLKTSEALGQADQITYYSAWYYSAIHVLLLVPNLQTKEALAEALQLPLAQISDALLFLSRCGLAREERGKFKTGHTRIHLPTDSPLTSRHHTNWRVRAIQSFDRNSRDDLHYSGAVALSLENAERIQAILHEAIDKMEPAIQAPGEEAGFSVCIDFFRM